MEAVREQGLDASIVLPTGICGPDDYAYGPVASFIIDYCAGKMPVGVAGSFNAVDARDLANAIVTCCDKGRKGESYILSNECVTMQQMFHLLSSLTGTKEVRMILPANAAKLLGRLSDLGGENDQKAYAHDQLCRLQPDTQQRVRLLKGRARAELSYASFC